MFSMVQDITSAVLGGTQLSGIDACENWEKATRLPDNSGPARWQPVYIELVPDDGDLVGPAATLLAAMVLTDELAADQEAQDRLLAMASGAFADARFFVFRPEGRAYFTSTAAGEALPFTILQVGPAIPVAFGGVALARPTLGPRGEAVGTRVLTGVVDDVMGFANERFRQAPTQTRVQHYWMQAMPVIAGGLARLGGELDSAAIDALLANATSEAEVYDHAFPQGVYLAPRGARSDAQITPYAGLNARPFGAAFTHGTQVLDLAAGWPMGQAPDRPILAVQLPQLATLESWGARLDLFVLLAVQRLLHWADHAQEAGMAVRAPLVINLSYGVLAGPKDGSGLVESEIARWVAARNAEGIATAVVLPSGNGYRTNAHAAFSLAAEESGAVTLRLKPDDQSVSFVEMWLDGLEAVRLQIVPPQGRAIDAVIGAGNRVLEWQGRARDGQVFPWRGSMCGPGAKRGGCRWCWPSNPARTTRRQTGWCRRAAMKFRLPIKALARWICIWTCSAMTRPPILRFGGARVILKMTWRRAGTRRCRAMTRRSPDRR